MILLMDSSHVVKKVFFDIDKGLGDLLAPCEGLRPWPVVVGQVVAAVELDLVEGFPGGDQCFVGFAVVVGKLRRVRAAEVDGWE